MALCKALPDIPLRYIPYEALHELAAIFDSPAIDGQRTLEGLAEAIYKLSNYQIHVDHIKVKTIKSRCTAGQSPTLEFLQALSKYKRANLQILQNAILSLETSVDDVLPRHLDAIMDRQRAEQGRRRDSDRSSQHACHCNDCSFPDNGHDFSYPSGECNNYDLTQHRHQCTMTACSPDYRANQKSRRQRVNDLYVGQGLPRNINITGVSYSDNLTVKNDFQNGAVISQSDFNQSETCSMSLFGNGHDFSPPDDFNPCPPSDLEDEDEESIVADEEGNFVDRTYREEHLKPKQAVTERRIKTEPTFNDYSTDNSESSRRHSHPIYQSIKPKKKDCESDGDIPNIPDECTCFRTPKISIGPKMVFVSLADDSKHHIKEVLILCNQLKKEGFEVKCDMMESLFTEQNINVNEWLDQCFKRACFVIFCISPKYYKNTRAESTSEAHPSDNKFHTRYIFDRARSEFIQNNSMNKRFLPVLFRNSSAKCSHIPEFLRSTLKYVFPENFVHLTDFMQRYWDRHYSSMSTQHAVVSQ